jgi:ketosteroid isomerase-like protein
MSEQQNTALIQEMYAAFARGDVAAILSHLTDDVEWTTEGPPIIPYTGKMVGPAKVQDFFKALGGTQENMKLTTDSFIAQGDKVATTGRYSGVVKATGKRFDCPVAHIFTIRDGKVSKFLDFMDTAHMVEAYTGTSTSAARG